MSNVYQDLLIEIGVEELPARLVKKLSIDFFNLLSEQLSQAQFIPHGKSQCFATPRRLAFLFEKINIQQSEQSIEKRGPAKEVAFNADGQPTPACLGFAKSNQVEVKDLEILETEKGSWVVYRAQKPGQNIHQLLSELLTQAYKKLPLPKTMSWGIHRIEFIRPVHWLVVMLDKEVVPIEFLHLKASNITSGHRLHAPAAIKIDSVNNYELLLLKNYVVADFSSRREKIKQQLQQLASQVQGKLHEDEALLNEVTALVEWPCALLGKFNQEFLQLPIEVIVTVMRHHQKCFAFFDHQGKILPYFITVANLESRDSQQVIQGNERVMKARLEDAKFFYQHDLQLFVVKKKANQEEVKDGIDKDSIYSKSARLSQSIPVLTQALVDAKFAENLSLQLAQEIALLAKADLVTGMVGEFPELQGIMGYYYAKAEGQPENIAIALKEQYLPRHGNDELPQSPYGIILALADRCDHLFHYFADGKIPTGDKDPFALRRAALGMVRILVEHKIPLSLNFLMQETQKTFTGLKNSSDGLTSKLMEFILERQRAWYLEQNGKKEIWSAVVNNISSEIMPFDVMQRLKAVEHFITMSEAAALIAANKRVTNLLAENKPCEIQESLFTDDAEKQLFAAISKKENEIEKFSHDYQKTLVSLAQLRPEIDCFFDQVMIMDHDEKIRKNRLALLARLNQLFKKVADISYLYGIA